MRYAICAGLGQAVPAVIAPLARRLEALSDSVEVLAHADSDRTIRDRIRHCGPDDTLILYVAGEGRFRAGGLELADAPCLDVGEMLRSGPPMFVVMDLRSTAFSGPARTCLGIRNVGATWVLVGATSGDVPAECRIGDVFGTLLDELVDPAANPLDLHPAAGIVPARSAAAEIRTRLMDAAERTGVQFVDYAMDLPREEPADDPGFFPLRLDGSLAAPTYAAGERLLTPILTVLANVRGAGMPFSVVRECFTRRLTITEFRSALATPGAPVLCTADVDGTRLYRLSHSDLVKELRQPGHTLMLYEKLLEMTMASGTEAAGLPFLTSPYLERHLVQYAHEAEELTRPKPKPKSERPSYLVTPSPPFWREQFFIFWALLSALVLAVIMVGVFTDSQRSAPVLLMSLRGHTGVVTAVRTSPDGRTIATGGHDGTLRLWDARTRREIRTLTVRSTVLSVAFAASPDLVAAGTSDGNIHVYDWAKNKVRHSIKTQGDHVRGLAFSPDGRTIASGTSDGVVRFWDTASGRLLRTVTLIRAGWIWSLAFSPDGRSLAVGTGSALHALDVLTFRSTFVARSDNWIRGVAFSPNGSRIASVDMNGDISVWNRQGAALLRIPSSYDHATAVSYSNDGRWLAVAGHGHTAAVFDADTGRQLRDLRGAMGQILALEFGPGDRTLVTGGTDGAVRTWNPATGKLIHTWTADAGNGIHSLAYAPDGSTIVAGGDDHSVMVWDAATGQRRTRRVEHTDVVWDLEFDSDGQLLATAGDLDGTVELWRATTGDGAGRLPRSVGTATNVAFDRSGRLAVSGAGGTVEIWRTDSRSLVKSIKAFPLAVLAMDLSHDGRVAVVGTEDGSAGLWDVETGRNLVGFPGRKGEISGADFDQRGTHVAVSGTDGKVMIYDVPSGRLIRTLQSRSSVWASTLSPNGARVAAGTSTGVVYLWDLRTGHLDHTFIGADRQPISSIAFAPDGNSLAVGARDETVRVWRLPH